MIDFLLPIVYWSTTGVVSMFLSVYFICKLEDYDYKSEFKKITYGDLAVSMLLGYFAIVIALFFGIGLFIEWVVNLKIFKKKIFKDKK